LIRFATRKACPLALLLALALASCGRRGELEPPIDARATAQPAAADDGEPQVRKKIPPIAAPKTSFFLDPLLTDTPTK
jgi:predicted small lipoprotein YifL